MKEMNMNNKVKEKNFQNEIIKNKTSNKTGKKIKINCFKFINLFILLFFIYALDKSKNIYEQLDFKNLINLKEEIIVSNSCEFFEQMKIKFNGDPNLNVYLEEISILSYVYNINNKNLKENKTNIHISMAFNNIYLFPVLIAIESVLTKTNKDKTFVTYHLLCSPDVTEITISKLKTLMNRYSNNLEIIFYGMGNSFIQFAKID